MKLKTIYTALFVCALATPTLAQIYEVSPAMCNNGSDSTIEIKNGTLNLGEGTFVRKGKKKDIGKGWFEARYSYSSEGEELPDVMLRLKITPQKVWLVDVTNNASYTATLCP